MSFFEDIVTQGTQYEGMELVGYSFGIALLLIPLVIVVSFICISIDIVWRVYKKQRIPKRETKRGGE